MMVLSDCEKHIIDIIQCSFPLTLQPFDSIGAHAGVSGAEVIRIVEQLEVNHVIRQIGAIYHTDALGFTGTLAGCIVPGKMLEKTALLINSHPGVSHNYQRDDIYNLWFTLAVPRGMDVARHAAKLRRKTAIQDLILLPKIKTYKRKVVFRVSGKVQAEPDHFGELNPGSDITPSSALGQSIMKELQKDLVLVRKPFDSLGNMYGLTGEEILRFIGELKSRKILARYAAILKNRTIGFTQNAMAVWNIPPDMLDDFGTRAASFEMVSHCYLRETRPSWNYNLYTMIHGKTREENSRIIEGLKNEFGVDDVRILYSVREFKKERINYFSRDFLEWDL